MRHPAVPAEPSFSWDDLLEYIEDRAVIPILGPELLTVEVEGRETLLLPWAAARLAERLGLNDPSQPAPVTLHEVAARHLQRGGQREDLYSRLRSVFKDVPLRPGECLRQLARVRHFRLYLTTTPDAALEQALREERTDEGGVDVLAYNPNHAQDLPGPMSELTRPLVYHLLGRLSSAPEYVISEEDQIEFLCALQQESKRPPQLLDELKEHHLLLLGCNLPDWLSRFLLRITKGSRLSAQRSASEILADNTAAHDPGLVVFMRNFSYRTRFYPDGGAREFVRELARRYAERHPLRAPGPRPPESPPGEAEPPLTGLTMSPGAIFLSYAKEDLEIAQRLRTALEAKGLEVWFDKAMLQWGDAWNARIQRNIGACSLFLPVISATTQRRLEGYFRLEWDLAAERAKRIADGVPFLLPLRVGEIGEADALVPDRFFKAQWAHLPDGTPSAELLERVVKLYRDYRRREKGLL